MSATSYHGINFSILAQLKYDNYFIPENYMFDSCTLKHDGLNKLFKRPAPIRNLYTPEIIIQRPSPIENLNQMYDRFGLSIEQKDNGTCKNKYLNPDSPILIYDTNIFLKIYNINPIINNLTDLHSMYFRVYFFSQLISIIAKDYTLPASIFFHQSKEDNSKIKSHIFPLNDIKRKNETYMLFFPNEISFLDFLYGADKKQNKLSGILWYFLQYQEHRRDLTKQFLFLVLAIEGLGKIIYHKNNKEFYLVNALDKIFSDLKTISNQKQDLGKYLNNIDEKDKKIRENIVFYRNKIFHMDQNNLINGDELFSYCQLLEKVFIKTLIEYSLDNIPVVHPSKRSLP